MKLAVLALLVFVSVGLAQDTSDDQAARDAGHAALQQKDNATAERELRKALELQPTAGQVSYWLGMSILNQRQIGRLPEGLYHLARAVVIAEGADVLSADDNQAAGAYLKKVYDRLRGSDEGLDQLKELVRQSAFPPSNFRISFEQGELIGQDPSPFARANPDIALWRTIRDAVLVEGGDKYFADIQGALIPPQDGPFKMFRGTVVTPAFPSGVLVNVDSLVGDALLLFDTPLTPAAAADAKLEFQGVIESFSKSPYVLMLRLSPGDLTIK